MPTNVHHRLVAIVSKYLGPAGERFVDRQIKSHLHKEPEDIDFEDIEPLKEWITVSVGLLTDDTELVDEIKKEINSLKNSHKFA